ncbi:MAG: cyclic pyranopterin monophosphate synthase MoaC [Candidatus Hydrogenedentes bacterium]|jgi:cyclic pyranopterin monophosphate synthase|nr:cyclic pyranopterin monophosphate synthase MoaC [Candidatus Hydrogenedentota bacterium]
MFTHVDEQNRPGIVDVSEKAVTLRTAAARSIITVPGEVIAALSDGEIQTKKGPVFQTAIIAGTMAAKQTSALIPLCHPLPLEGCKVEISVSGANDIVIECRVKTHHKTGVEMEALTGATVAALTVYDMCKAFSHDMVIRETRLIEKHGGKRDVERAP